MTSILNLKLSKQVDTVNLEELNQHYRYLRPEERIKEIFKDFDSSKILLTSSFGATAVYLLNLFSMSGFRPKVHFIDTTYHFEETIAYKELIGKKLNLDIIDVLPDPDFNEMTTKSEIWKHDADLCCLINKVQPLDKIKANFDVWVSGLMSWQTMHRKKLQIFEESQRLIKFYPILDVSEEEVKRHLKIYNLPTNPLLTQGYGSIGCKHCTKKGESREGRWTGSKKTECGLHTS